MKIIKRDMFYATGSGSAAVFLPQDNGQIVCRSMWYTSAAAGTLKFYRARQSATANAAVSASTTLVVKTTVLGYVGGAVLTTNDFVLVESSANGWQYRTIATVAGVSSSTVSLILGSAITCAAGETIHIVRAADVVSATTGTETQRDLRYVFNGFLNRPVYVLLTAAGTDLLSIAVDYERLN